MKAANTFPKNPQKKRTSIANSEWVADEKYAWVHERVCACGHKQVISDRLDSPQQYFLTDEEYPTLDLTPALKEGINPATTRVTAAAATYTYRDFAAGKDAVRLRLISTAATLNLS